MGVGVVYDMAAPHKFFQLHLRSFIRGVDLGDLVRKLWEKEVLNEDEYQKVNLQTIIENERKEKLCYILHGKPDWVPWEVLDCLEDSNPNISQRLLADDLKRYLQQWPEGRHQFRLGAAVRADALSALQGVNPQFANAISAISNALHVDNVSFESLLTALNTISRHDGIPLSIPAVVPDFPSLVVLL